MFDLLKSAIAVAVVLGAACGGAQAQEKNACDQFKWSVARERGWFADVKPVASGAAIAAGQGYAVTLAPNESVDELGLAKGKAAYAVIKSSDVMIGID